jgi:hypothetical protein
MRNKHNLKPSKKSLKIKGGEYSKKYLEVLKKYYYIFGFFTTPFGTTYIFDKILESDIFKKPKHIDTLITYLNEKTTTKTLDNESQITEILIPALDKFINNVLKKNKPYPTSPENVAIIGIFSLPTETLRKKILTSERIQKILEKSLSDNLIETFKKDLEILKMNPSDKEQAKINAKDDVFFANPANTESAKKPSPESSSKKNKEKAPIISSDEHFGILAAKPKTKRRIHKRKKKQTKRYYRHH